MSDSAAAVAFKPKKSVALSGTPGTTLAYWAPLPCTMPFALAEYGALNTENGKPLCQNAVPETCHPFSARASM